jgi:hypothetical protein
MFKIRIHEDRIGNLGFTFFSVGHQFNEVWEFPPMVRRVVKEGEIIGDPSFSVPNNFANEFMLALKEAIREYEGSTPDFSQGELKATKYHLEDMRNLIFNLFAIKEICKE